MKRALILVDIQNDFLPGGALAVPEGDLVIPLANELQKHVELVVATQDWHPPDHGSFAASHACRKAGEVIDLDGLPQILWPVHCVQNTRGAELAPALDRDRVKRIFHKGVDPRIDSYSTFFDNAHRRSTGLGDYLRGEGITDVYLAGLATDYCVKFSVLDARHLDFNTFVVLDACRGIDLKRGDIDRAIESMREAGARVIRSDELRP